ncbi:hypothetical protein [Dickeya chrysanthemi]|uniref:hypothetical protein n=1 Tax=Dickeya chrysanthemi TaxID=556 RepID=UPI0003A0CAA6
MKKELAKIIHQVGIDTNDEHLIEKIQSACRKKRAFCFGTDNSLGLKTVLATAGAKNGIRDAETDRQMSILTGGPTGLRELLKIGSET